MGSRKTNLKYRLEYRGELMSATSACLAAGVSRMAWQTWVYSKKKTPQEAFLYLVLKRAAKIAKNATPNNGVKLPLQPYKTWPDGDGDGT